MFFDPDAFAVTAGFDGERVTLPGKPLSPFGMRRQVVIDPQDLPMPMVCFTLLDMQSALLGERRDFLSVVRTLQGHVTRGLIPFPVFAVVPNAQLYGPTTKHVYLYPEAHAIYSALLPEGDPSLGIRPAVFAKNRPTMLEAIHAARTEALETTE